MREGEKKRDAPVCCVYLSVCCVFTSNARERKARVKEKRERERDTEGIIINVFTAGKLVTVPVVVEDIKNTLIPC